jgi:putative hydrolase of the HAD superfamily
MKTKHLFFDLDRTLWDFEKNSEIALNHLFHELGLQHSIDHFDSFFQLYKENNSILWKKYGSGQLKKEELRDERFRLTLENLKVNDPILVKKISDGYVELSPQQTALFPNAIETLKDLQKEGFNMHIITNGFKEVQYIKLDKSGLSDYFDVIVCSEDVGKNKPAPDIFHYSLNRANAKAIDSVMIGDDFEVDVLGALNIGMKGVHFDPYQHHTSHDDTLRIQELSELPGMMPWIFKINL